MEGDMEDIIANIITQYGTQIWLSFVSLVGTGFVMNMAKGFVEEFSYYIRARMSDIGYGQLIYWDKTLFYVKSIHFKYILIKDKDKLIRIPIKTYLNNPVSFPLPGEEKLTPEEYEDKHKKSAGEQILNQAQPFK
jgi:hypothetical protein